MALQKPGDDPGNSSWVIDPSTGQVVPASGAAATGDTPGIGGPSPGERDNPGTESFPNQGGGTSGGTTGGGGGSTTDTTTTFDWRAYLTDWGFPPDVVNELDRIFRQYSDPNQAGAAALAYIRGTDWYHQTFAGIENGIKNGVVGNEADYRSYVNQVNQFYRRYYGRDVTTNEIAGYLNGGVGIGAIGSHLQGQAYVTTNQNDINYTLGAFDNEGRPSGDQLNALGDEVGGLDSTVGQQLQKRLDLARQKMQRIFQGQAATPALSILSTGGLAASSLGGKTPDVAA